MYTKYFKRLLDCLLSGIGILVLLPVWFFIVLAILIDDPGRIFFRQKRIAIHKKHFNILKFRTMKMSTPHDTPTHMLKNPEQYITRVGAFLRKTSLDELPQLFNIFVGQMSIIGPRPALWNQFDLIEERDKYGANDIKPGLTGWAQINGYRGDTSIRKRIEYDIYYIENWSMSFDFKIMFLTIFKGFINENAY